MVKKRERGQGLVEYALIIVLVAVVVIVGLRALGPRIRDLFNELSYRLAVAQGAEQETVIEAFAVSGQPYGLSGCRVTASQVTVRLTQGGFPVQNQTVSGVLTLQDGTSRNISGTTDSEGRITWTNIYIGIDGMSICDGTRTATADIAGATATDNY